MIMTAAKGTAAGEVTLTVTVCPGLTTVPPFGDVIWSNAGTCWASDGEIVSAVTANVVVIRRAKHV